jgi:bis(5'-nucleosyl)-tetraphosphatase (symmetrical)
MAIYAIGDVQGCYKALSKLLTKIDFDPSRDRLWFTGDLVNRGPSSADVIRLVMRLGDSAISVLGNHDLHLLAVAAGMATPESEGALDDVLLAPDRDGLLSWLSRRPLLHFDPIANFVLVHGGLHPAWDMQTALACAREAEAVIQSTSAEDFYRHMYGDKPRRWRADLTGWDRIRFIVNVLTRARYCTADGEMDYRAKGAIGSQPAGLVPWFDVPDRQFAGPTVIFGHWSDLGLWRQPGVIGLDTGCVWGRQLTAVRLGRDLEFFNVDCGNLR